MQTKTVVQGTILDDHLETWLEAFLLDRKTQNMTKGTLYFYQKKAALLVSFCEGQAITRITQIDAGAVRAFLGWLADTGHNAGGQHACYRVLRAFLRWWVLETEPENWTNPLKRVKPPRLGQEPLDPVSLEIVKAMLETCGKDFHGERDRALLLCLLDTGARAAEVCALNVDDLNQVTGEMLIKQGKGRKPRTVFLGQKSRRALRAYLRKRADHAPALWVTLDGERLTYWGLRQMVRRRAGAAGVEEPQLHAFRRAFALNALRAGMDIYSLQLLMGHADLQILRRYLKQNAGDLARAHSAAGVVDGLLS